MLKWLQLEVHSHLEIQLRPQRRSVLENKNLIRWKISSLAALISTRLQMNRRKPKTYINRRLRISQKSKFIGITSKMKSLKVLFLRIMITVIKKPSSSARLAISFSKIQKSTKSTETLNFTRIIRKILTGRKP